MNQKFNSTLLSVSLVCLYSQNVLMAGFYYQNARFQTFACYVWIIQIAIKLKNNIRRISSPPT